MNVGNVELHDPQADTLDVRIEHFAVGADQLALGLVESRLAIAARPPQVGLLEIRHDAARVHECDLLAPPCLLAVARQREAELRLVVQIERQLGLEIDEQAHVARSRIDMRGHPRNVREAGGLEHAQLDAAPQPCAHQTGHDVPSVHVRRLADIDRFLGREITQAEHAEQMVLRRRHDRADDHLHRIFASLLDQVRDVEAALDQHVGRAAGVLAVDPDVGQAVDAAEPQLGTLSLRKFRSGEAARVAPLMSFPRAQLIDIGPDHRVVDQAGGEQVELDIARNLGGNRLYLDPFQFSRIGNGLGRLFPVGEFPRPVQRDRPAPRRSERQPEQQAQAPSDYRISFHRFFLLRFIG